MTVELYPYRLDEIEERVKAGEPIATPLIQTLIDEIRRLRRNISDIRAGKGTIQEVRLNEDGTLDEIVVDDAFIHLEQMDKNAWWMGIGRGNSPYLMLNFTSKKKITGTWDDEGLGCTVKTRGASLNAAVESDFDTYAKLIGPKPPVTEEATNG